MSALYVSIQHSTTTYPCAVLVKVGEYELCLGKQAIRYSTALRTTKGAHRVNASRGLKMISSVREGTRRVPGCWTATPCFTKRTPPAVQQPEYGPTVSPNASNTACLFLSWNRSRTTQKETRQNMRTNTTTVRLLLGTWTVQWKCSEVLFFYNLLELALV